MEGNREPGKKTRVCRLSSEMGHEIPDSRCSSTEAEPNTSADNASFCHPESTDVWESLGNILHFASVGATPAGLILTSHPCIQERTPSTGGAIAGCTHADLTWGQEIWHRVPQPPAV